MISVMNWSRNETFWLVSLDGKLESSGRIRLFDYKICNKSGQQFETSFLVIYSVSISSITCWYYLLVLLGSFLLSPFYFAHEACRLENCLFKKSCETMRRKHIVTCLRFVRPLRTTAPSQRVAPAQSHAARPATFFQEPL